MLFFGGITLIEVIIDGFIFYKIISYGFLGLILIGNALKKTGALNGFEISKR